MLSGVGQGLDNILKSQVADERKMDLVENFEKDDKKTILIPQALKYSYMSIDNKIMVMGIKEARNT